MRTGAGPDNKEAIVDIEQLWYEYSPYLYLLAGCCAAIFTRSLIGVGSGLLLIILALTIVKMRSGHRARQVRLEKQRRRGR